MFRYLREQEDPLKYVAGCLQMQQKNDHETQEAGGRFRRCLIKPTDLGEQDCHEIRSVPMEVCIGQESSNDFYHYDASRLQPRYSCLRLNMVVPPDAPQPRTDSHLRLRTQITNVDMPPR